MSDDNDERIDALLGMVESMMPIIDQLYFSHKLLGALYQDGMLSQEDEELYEGIDAKLDELVPAMLKTGEALEMCDVKGWPPEGGAA